MKEWRFKRKYFEMISSGRKRLEARLNYPSTRNVKVSDIIRFFWEDCSLNVRILEIRTYVDLRRMIERERVDLLIPDMNKERALEEYRKIYPDWKVKEYGGISVFSFEIIS